MRRMQAMTCSPTKDRPAWLFTSYLELGALPGAVPCARLHAKQMLWEWGLDDLADTVELLVSELVTNAQRASGGHTSSRYRGRWTAGVPPVRLWLSADEGRLLIRVWDGDRELPEPQGIDLEAESGRGLLLVESLSAEWGAYALEGSSGKVVWAAVPLRGDLES
jgi:anti-sigma regulatory factor (Ser/Thr protein kinase)